MNKYIAISDARATLPDLVEKVNTKYDEVVITVNGKPKAVIMSLEEVESLKETAEVLAIPGALESIKKGREEIKRGEFVKLSDLK